MFLLSCYEMAQRGEASPLLRVVWSRASELLIANGADLGALVEGDDRQGGGPGMTVRAVMVAVFGEDEVRRLRALAVERRSRHAGGHWYSNWWRR